MLKIRCCLLYFSYDLLTTLEIVRTELKLTNLVFNVDNLRRIFSFVIVKKHLDCFLEIVFASVVNSLVLGLIILYRSIGIKFHR